MNRTITSNLIATLALAMLLGCSGKENPPAEPNPALSTEVAPAAALPRGTPIAQVTGNTKLIRYFDEEAGMLCYMMDDFRSSPNCSKVAEPKKPYTDM